MTLCYDSVTGDACPLNSQIVAGYIDGSYGPNDKFGSGWSPAAWARYPNAYHVTITVAGTPGARAADCESGAMTIANTVKWAQNEIRGGRRPTIYADLYDWSEHSGCLDQALAAVGLKRVRDVDGWVADIGPPSIPAGFVARQYAQGVNVGTGHNVDISITNGSWPYTAIPTPVVPSPAPPPVPQNLTELFTVNTVDTTTNGTWIVDPSDGHVEARNGAPYLGGLNEPVADKYHWKEVGNITGITTFVDQSGLGYAIIVRHFAALPDGSWYSMYSFPRNGSAISAS